jgi:hypothetical protein
MKTITEVTKQNSRIYHGLTKHYHDLIKQAHPSTGGNFLLAHNWGNEKAKELLDNYYSHLSWLFAAYRNAQKKSFAYEYPTHINSIKYFKTVK